MGSSPNWTKEELEYLENHWGQVSIPSIAKHLGRSVNAVKLKAGRCGLGRHIHSGVRITLLQFCEAIGKRNSYGWIKDRWARLGLPIHYQKSITKRYAMVDIDEFWVWAEQHKDIVDFSAFPEGTFGKEPEWVAAARHASWLAKMKKTPWTPAEDAQLEYMLKAYRYTFDDLCRELNRTEGAIKRRILTLGLSYRPLRNYDKHWTDDEVETLLRMKAEGHCWEEIGRSLHRSGSAVRGKYERLQNPEYCKRYYRRQRESLQEYFQKDQCVYYKKTEGCTLNKDNCDTCSHFTRRKPGEHIDTGWASIRSATPEELLQQQTGGKI
ncbi:MAG: hypothetical protein LUD19_03620 [Clostridia bacterium]|nr:hypothetical protein [Clostridia bacterium]